MAPTRNPKPATGAADQKPAALATVAKARRVLPKKSHAQRSSLRLAVQKSQCDATAVAAPTVIVNTPSSSLNSSQSSHSSLASALVSPATPQRSSLRQALKESLQGLAPPTTPSQTLPSSPPDSVSTTDSIFSTARSTSSPSTAPPTPSPSTTSASPFASSPSSIRSKLQRYINQRQSQLSQDSESDHNESKNGRRKEAKATAKADKNGIPTSVKGWYQVRSIITEMRNKKGGLMYLVDWEGVNPRTGVAWPSEWVSCVFSSPPPTWLLLSFSNVPAISIEPSWRKGVTYTG
ncbi:hypothetical protein F4804DRAFT_311572 [Jackrogersella minutella]|nr:hypothetical protein F4804DRAFT_311572 [Jackrogersella minutella]